MKRYEYLTVYYGKTDVEPVPEMGNVTGATGVSDYPYKISRSNELNDLGAQGWELVAFFNTKHEDFPYAVFKREII